MASIMFSTMKCKIQNTRLKNDLYNTKQKAQLSVWRFIQTKIESDHYRKLSTTQAGQILPSEVQA